MVTSVEVSEVRQSVAPTFARLEGTAMRNVNFYRITEDDAQALANEYAARGYAVTTPRLSMSGSYVVTVTAPIADGVV